jgi:hypothetical protein
MKTTRAYEAGMQLAGTETAGSQQTDGEVGG